MLGGGGIACTGCCGYGMLIGWVEPNYELSQVTVLGLEIMYRFVDFEPNPDSSSVSFQTRQGPVG